MLKPLKSYDRTTDPLYLFPKTDEIMSFASGTRLDCEYYHWYQNTSDPAFANCYALSILYSIEFEDFILWNPSLADTSTTEDYNGTDSASVTDNVTSAHDFTNSCTISSNRLYCVALSASATSTSAKTGIATPTPRAGGREVGIPRWYSDDEDDDEIDPETYQEL
ncbi:uncharacterized protein FIESC28_03404 [Fusarium coffeatum]|uniref:Uncharacterized protein n=1 Tax=Fusarium coffeatum TaxID=231269 RepID=A0A366S4I6_9HYPO|nr:uncharacterized protein FIESC28_03404 [Fusarium coffeatum]RBR23788.1 hypothetical protein FIESC28_03404 [Fusarium coffeatum]